MLDIKSNLVLKILQKECKNGGYKVIEKSDIISAMPIKYRVDDEGLEHIINYLERCECIHVKYDDDNVFCLCILPLGNQITEKEEKNQKKSPKNIIFLIIFVIFSFIFSFAGAIVGEIIAKFIK